jgi:hypothetical protein
MTLRRIGVAAALAAFAAGCGNEKCSDQTPPVQNVQDCTVAEASPVSIQIRACPRCDQAAPRCLVRMENVGTAANPGTIQLEALSEVCDANSSCPIVNPSSCAAGAVTCTFTAPAQAALPYGIVVVTPEGTTIDRTLTVGPAGTAQSCAFRAL